MSFSQFSFLCPFFLLLFFGWFFFLLVHPLLPASLVFIISVLFSLVQFDSNIPNGCCVSVGRHSSPLFWSFKLRWSPGLKVLFVIFFVVVVVDSIFLLHFPLTPFTFILLGTLNEWTLYIFNASIFINIGLVLVCVCVFVNNEWFLGFSFFSRYWMNMLEQKTIFFVCAVWFLTTKKNSNRWLWLLCCLCTYINIESPCEYHHIIHKFHSW